MRQKHDWREFQNRLFCGIFKKRIEPKSSSFIEEMAR